MEQAFQATAEIGVPIINCGPGGTSDDESAWPEVFGLQDSVYAQD